MTETTEAEVESYPNRVEQAEALSDELLEVQTATTSEGNLRATVSEIVRDPPGYPEGIVVRAMTPTGTEISHHFDTPEPWTDEQEFVRWVRGYGAAAGALSELVDSEVLVSDGELVVPDPPRSLLDKLHEWRESAFFFGMGFVGALLVTGMVAHTVGTSFGSPSAISIAIGLSSFLTIPMGGFMGMMFAVIILEEVFGIEPPDE